MSETVLKLEMSDAVDEQRLAQVVDQFARWRDATAKPCAAERDGPDIMIKTTCGLTSICKTLIFQDPAWADKFLALWQTEAPQAS